MESNPLKKEKKRGKELEKIKIWEIGWERESWYIQLRDMKE